MLDDLFPKKLRLGDPPKPKGKPSLLTMKIQTSPKPKENPFTDFSPYDAHDRPPSESMTVRVLLTALQEFQEPEDSTDSGKTIHKSKIFQIRNPNSKKVYLTPRIAPISTNHWIDLNAEIYCDWLQVN